MTTWVWIWLGIIALFVVVEACTMEMVSFWCIFGAIVAMILALLEVPVWAQWLAFGIVSVVLLLCLRRIVQKFLSKGDARTNADAEFGNTAILLTPIKRNECGTIKIKGIIWSATTQDKSEIDAGETVELINIEGNKYIVKRINLEKEDK